MTSVHDARQEDGNITLLSLGFAIFAILLILVGAAVTGIHLDRVRLTHVADELALDAADAMDVGAYYAGNAPPPTAESGIALSESAARTVVASRVNAVANRYGLEDVTVIEVASRDGRTVTVTVAVTSHPEFGLDAWMPWGDVRIVASSSARVH
jgi:hypothetical protein